METLQRSESDEGTPGAEQPSTDIRQRAVVEHEGTRADRPRLRDRARTRLWAFVEPKIRTTIITVLVAVGASAAIWIGANLLFDQVRQRWLTFSTIVFAIVGALVGITLHGNGSPSGPERGS